MKTPTRLALVRTRSSSTLSAGCRPSAAGTWSTVRDSSVRNKHCAATQMCVRNGVLFVVGGDEFSPARVVLQRSTNGGSSWTTVATFAESSLSHRAGDMVFGPSGTLYLAGSAAFEGTYPNSGFKCCMRRYLTASTTWITDWPFGTNADEGTSGASGLSVNEAGSVFATGFGRDPDGSYASAVQRLVEEGELP